MGETKDRIKFTINYILEDFLVYFRDIKVQLENAYTEIFSKYKHPRLHLAIFLAMMIFLGFTVIGIYVYFTSSNIVLFVPSVITFALLFVIDILIYCLEELYG